MTILMRALVSMIVFTGCTLAQGTGDESAFVPSSYGDMQISLGDGFTISTTFFESVRNLAPNSESKVFAFTPYFEFVTFNVGGAPPSTARYQVVGPLANGTYTVKMRVACYDNALKNAAAISLSASIGSTITPAAVQVLPLFQLRVKEENTGATASIPENGTPDTKIELQPVQDILFKGLSASDKDQLVKLVDGGQASFTFTYSFKKAGTSITSAAITMDQMMHTDTFQNLTGGGTGFVTRNGMATVATKMFNDLDIKAYIEDPADVNAVLDKLINLFFTTAKFKEDVDYQKADNLKRLSALSIDPNGPDTEATRIQVTHDAVASSHDYNDVNHNLQQGAGSVGYGPFKADCQL